MKREKLLEVLKLHQKWVRGEGDGVIANLSGADLYGADLYGANLSRADLSGADLSRADLYGADLSGADLSRADLSRADLYGANLSRANLSRANLYGANLYGADLYGADLSGADLSKENISLINFQICPQEGAFIAWKATRDHVLKIEVPSKAKRTSTVIGRKCRASYVKTLEVYDKNGDVSEQKVVSGWKDSETKYQRNRITKPDKYDANPLIDCTHGIHFFMTRKEAQDWIS